MLPSRTPILFQPITTARTVAASSTETLFRPRFPTFFTNRSPRILIDGSTTSPPSTPSRIEVAASVADMMAGKEEKEATTSSTTEVPVFHTTSAASLGNNTLELRGGSGPHEGNVFINGFPVCEDDETNVNQWRRAEANVVCRMFGYVGAAAAHVNCRLEIKQMKSHPESVLTLILTRFGDCGNDWEVAGINCEGTENSILDCIVGKPTDACNKGSEGAGVRCIV